MQLGTLKKQSCVVASHARSLERDKFRRKNILNDKRDGVLRHGRMVHWKSNNFFLLKRFKIHNWIIILLLKIVIINNFLL